MTNLEIGLILILWLLIGIIIGVKWKKASPKDGGLIIVSIIFCPIVFIVAIVRQVLIEGWR